MKFGADWFLIHCFNPSQIPSPNPCVKCNDTDWENVGMDAQTITDLDAPTLRKLSQNYHRLIRKLDARACELETIDAMRAQTRSRLNALSALPQMVAEQIDLGRDLNFEFSHVAKIAGCPLETILAYWSQWLKSRDEQIKCERTILVMRLASRGLHNVEICQRTGIPKYTVSRIISKALGKRRKPS